MNIKDKKVLVKYLRNISKGKFLWYRITGKMNLNVGLCWNIKLKLNISHVEAIHLVAGIALDWPKYSGSAGYPVPHNEIHSGVAFYGIKNKYADKYGKDRMELAGFIADTLENRYGS